MSFAKIATLVATILCACLVLLSTVDMQWYRVGITDLGNTYNAWVSLPVLFAFRITAALLIWCSLIYIIIDPAGVVLVVENKDGSRRNVTIHSFSRLTMFTVWSWILQGVYFALASYASFLTININEENNISVLPSYFPTIGWVLYEVSLPISFLVSGVVSFVLLPTMRKGGFSVDFFFKPVAVLMHNANVLFMTFEFIANGLPIHFWHFVFMLFYATAYVVFAWVWHYYKKIFYYFFLDYSRPDALGWHIGLVVGVFILYCIGCVCNSISQHYSSLIPNIVITVLAVLSMTLYDTEGIKGASATK